MDCSCHTISHLNCELLIRLKNLRILSQLISSQLQSKCFRQLENEIDIRISVLSFKHMCVEHIRQS